MRPNREHSLPVVFSVDEVQRILGCLRLPRYRVCLSTIYTCGLRLQEGVHLQVPDIDSDRMILHVRHGKGSKDRYVPLPECTLLILRQHGVTHRHPVGLSPTTALYTHLTVEANEQAGQIIEQVVSRLAW